MTRVTRGGSVSLAAMSCDMLGLLELLPISLLCIFVFVNNCFHVVHDVFDDLVEGDSGEIQCAWSGFFFEEIKVG